MQSRRFWHAKHVVITGASSGIGAALAQYLATQGARVGLIARRYDLLEQLQADIRNRGGEASAARADVADPDMTCQAIRALEQTLGHCDVLIANAGIYHKTSGSNFNLMRANAVITTNILGLTNALGAVLPGMVERRSGHVAAVASLAAMLGLPAGGAYCASKAAMVTLMESLRVDLYRFGIRVTTICPSFVNTPMLPETDRTTMKHLMSADEAARRITHAIERGRAEYWFPWHDWLVLRLIRCAPPGVSRRLIARLLPEMEEA